MLEFQGRGGQSILEFPQAVEEGGEMFKLNETGNLKSRGLVDTFYQGQ